MTLNDIHLRDPFVVPVASEGRFYLYGTNGHIPQGTGFDAFTSTDLRTWEGPIAVFRPPAGFWGTQDFWAPEVHPYQERYYLFASFIGPGHHRGTAILVADSPAGPFQLHSNGAVTPQDWGCLDGTLYVDEFGTPWMVFCHEWLQVGDGEMVCMELSPDLKQAAGAPVLLFRASQPDWTAGVRGPEDGYVTDGPFLFRAGNGELLMLWASFTEAIAPWRENPTAGFPPGYAQAVARSVTGNIRGPWIHDPAPLYADNGGHGMLFRTFEGQLMLTLHRPNTPPDERPVLFRGEERDGRLTITPWAQSPEDAAG